MIALLRVKNESRWIERVINSLHGVCSPVIVFDDNSTDDTRAIALRAGAIVVSSPFDGSIDEARDKNYLLDCAFEYGKARIGDWCLMIDGDEELMQEDAVKLIAGIVNHPRCDVFSLRILYLWNQPDLIRVDGVYGNFRRPSVFRLIGRTLTFRKTSYGAHFHCGNIPQQLLGASAADLDVRLLHYGYIDEELRRRKFDFYNRIDPNNLAEDCYRHITQGDTGGVSASAVLRHAGPLRLARI